ncbi:MAG: EpsG family protein [Clostridiales bacterium]|nr:EpsG family protein [Clostridiales bacterium]
MFILAFALEVSSLSRKTKSLVYLGVVFTLFTLFMGLRKDSVGNDTYVYIDLFKKISTLKEYHTFSSRYETGFLIINYLISLFSESYTVYLMVTAIFVNFFAARFIYNNSVNPWLSTILYFSLGYWSLGMSSVRAALSISVVLIAFDFVKKNKILGFIATILVASTIHSGALILLFLLLIKKMKPSYRTLGRVLIGTILLYISFDYLFDFVLVIFPKYKYYLGTVYLDGNIKIASVLNLVISILILIFYQVELNSNSKSKDQESPNIFFPALLLGIVIQVLSFKFRVLDRVAQYMLISTIIILPITINKIKSKKHRTIYTVSASLVFIFYFIVIQVMRPYWYGVIPYDFFFSW